MAETDSKPPKGAPAEVAEEPPSISPLTRRGYQRTKATQKEIAGALGLGAAELIARSQQRDEKAPDYMSAEALVFFIRRADRAGDGKTRDALIRELVERCTPFFRGQFRGCNEEDRKDLQGAVIATLIDDILDPGDRGDFMQARFWLYLKRKTISVWNELTKNAADTESLDATVSGDDGAEGTTRLDLQADGRLTLEELAIVSDGLAKLPPHIRRAFILRYAFEMKIGADNPADDPPDEETLAWHFGRSGRTIRNWLKEAKTRLAGFREK
jgi:hypothetical protein